MKFALPLLIATFISHPALAAWSQTCGQGVAKNLPYRWCIDEPVGSSRRHLIYYFHGYSGSEKSWQAGPDARDLERLTRARDVAVVSLSFGEAWLLTNVAHRGKISRLLPLTINHVMPEVEKQLGVSNPVRDLRGDSMGGYNVSALMLARPDLFRRVAIVCPMLSGLSPRASANELDAFVEKTGARRGWVVEALEWLKWEFPNDREWHQENPLEAALSPQIKSLRVHVSCGDQDEYGYHETARAMSERLRTAGVSVEWQSLNGGHCVSDGARLAHFFIDP